MNRNQKRIALGDRVAYVEAAGGLLGHLVRHGEVISIVRHRIASLDRIVERYEIMPEPAADPAAPAPRALWVDRAGII